MSRYANYRLSLWILKAAAGFFYSNGIGIGAPVWWAALGSGNSPTDLAFSLFDRIPIPNKKHKPSICSVFIVH
jgi:hypothetical protein